MSEFKGTKGNWITFCNDETKEYSVGGGNDERYFIAKVHSTGRSIETNNANVNLIASAPQLLDVIQKAMSVSDLWMPPEDANNPEFEEEYLALSSMYSKFEEVIKLATKL